RQGLLSPFGPASRASANLLTLGGKSSACQSNRHRGSGSRDPRYSERARRPDIPATGRVCLRAAREESTSLLYDSARSGEVGSSGLLTTGRALGRRPLRAPLREQLDGPVELEGFGVVALAETRIRLPVGDV